MAADPGQRRFPVEMSNASDGSRSLEFNVALLDGLWIVIGYSVVGVPQRESLSNSICEYLQLGIRAGQGTGKRVFFVFGWIWFIVPLSLPDRFKNWTIHHFSLNTKLVLTRLFWLACSDALESGCFGMALPIGLTDQAIKSCFHPTFKRRNDRQNKQQALWKSKLIYNNLSDIKIVVNKLGVEFSVYFLVILWSVCDVL